MLADHPALRLRLLVDDSMIDLIDARVDLALRAGRLADSTWAARRLCRFAWMLCAAPSYLAQAGVPKRPQDLLAHQWIAAPRDGQHLLLELQGPGDAREALRIAPRITSNNQLTLQQMAASGLGLVLAVRADVDDDLRAGRLVAVLPEWTMPPMPVWAVTPQRDGQPAKVRHAVEALQAYLRAIPGALAD